MYPIIIGIAAGGYILGKGVEYAVDYFTAEAPKPRKKRKHLKGVSAPDPARPAEAKPKNKKVAAKTATGPTKVVRPKNKRVTKGVAKAAAEKVTAVAEVVAEAPANAVRASQPVKAAPKGPKPTLAQQIAAKVAAGELQVPPSHEA
jgi:hypothetical protein